MADRFDWSKLSGAIVSRTSDALNEAKQLKDSMSQQDKPSIDWSKWSDAITSRASHALKETKQLKDSMSQQDKPAIDWSKWSDAITSRASHALKETKQLKDSMSQQDKSAIDWSKWSDAITSRASHALKEAKQLKDSMSQQDLPKSDWSKMSGAVASRASDALNEVKQLLSKDSIYQKDHVDMSHIDWSKLWSDSLSRASDAVNEVGRLVDFMLHWQQDIGNDWTKLLATVLSRASRVLTELKKLNYVSISREWSFAITNAFQQQLRRFIEIIQNIPWSKLWGDIFPRLQAFALYVSAEANDWSIRYPYVTAGVLLSTSGLTNPVIFLSLMKLTGGATLTVGFLPVRFLVWFGGFRSQGVVAGSLASLYQSHSYGGLVPRASPFALLQSYGATTLPVTPGALISLLMYPVAVYVLGRHWGWWN